MIATALFVAPFHRFAAVYVGCYGACLLVRWAGVGEADVNLLWHSAALAFALHFPNVMRSHACLAVLVLFAPLLAADALRLSGVLSHYDAWWAVWWIVMAQLAILPFGADWQRARALVRSWRAGSTSNFQRVEAA